MLLREDGDAVVCIGQPAHAWLSGQLARAWALDPVEPWEEVCLAAEQHDLGMAGWAGGAAGRVPPCAPSHSARPSSPCSQPYRPRPRAKARASIALSPAISA